MFRISPRKLTMWTFITKLVHGKWCEPNIETVTSIKCVKICSHIPISGLRMEPGSMVCSLLPHRRSWGSGRWRCTWTTNSRQIPPTIQRYIPINVQQKDSNSSEDWVMGVSLAWVLLQVYFRASSRRHGRRRGQLARRGTKQLGEMG
jgi:hypothetical protein